MLVSFIALLAAVGMSHIVVDGTIFAKWRGRKVKWEQETKRKSWLLELSTCYQCTGFWAGVFMGLVLQPISWGFAWYWCLPLWLLVTPFVFGCAASYASMAGAGLLNYLDAPMALVRSRRNNNESN